VLLARGYASATDPRVHVGLGARAAATVSVQWRSGARERFGDVGAGGRYRLTEGEGRAQPLERFVPRPALSSAPWPATLEQVLSGQQGPALVQLFMESCAPCRREVPRLNALAARGLTVVGLGLHAEAALQAVRGRLGMRYPVQAMPEAVATAFEGSNGLALPTVLVYGNDGALLRVVAGEEHLPRVLAELGLAPAR
jgi:thiol-disulfide isomerase/thioredoxin